MKNEELSNNDEIEKKFESFGISKSMMTGLNRAIKQIENINKWAPHIADMQEKAKSQFAYMQKYRKLNTEFLEEMKKKLPAIAGMNKFVEEHMPSFLKTIEFASNWQSDLEKWGPALRAMQRIKEQTVEAFLSFERMRETHNEENALLFLYGWPPLLDIPNNFFKYFIEIHEKTDDKEERQKLVDKIIVEYYNETFLRENILSNWRNHSCLKSRIHILEKVFLAHFNGDYELSVPAILPHIEGVIIESLSEGRNVRKKDYKKLQKKLLQQHSLYNDDEKAEDYINEILYKNFEVGQDDFGVLNRHAILHGANIDYTDEATSLRAILLMDFVLSRLQFVSIIGSSVYHVLGCKLIKISSKEKEYFIYASFFEQIGKQPCKRCIKENYI